jgi:hypothetical protein
MFGPAALFRPPLQRCGMGRQIQVGSGTLSGEEQRFRTLMSDSESGGA